MTERLEESGSSVGWSSLLAQAVEIFRSAGLESPEVDARRVVEELTGSEPSRFFAVLDQPATHRAVARFDSLVARRAAGEPLQYVLGRWGFRGLDLLVDRRVLIPRPETELVAGLAIDEVVARSASRESLVIVVDLGTGSGAIALSIATECSHARVMAVDQSADALVVASANLAGIGRAATRVSLHEGDWFGALPVEAQGTVEVIVANPPYVATGERLPADVDDWEPSEALRAGPGGDESLLAIVDEADGWLAPGGAVVLEMAPHQTDAIVARWHHHGYEAAVHDDLAGRPRAVVAAKPR